MIISSTVLFGFRDKCSTAVGIFCYISLYRRFFLKKSKLYCAFINYEKAFDSVNRHVLWGKLIKLGVSCKMIKMLKSTYSNVKSCLRLPNENKYSEFLEVTIGLKQGDQLSTIFFFFL